MICTQFIFKPATYDEEFHRLDEQIDRNAHSLPGFAKVEKWEAQDIGVINAIYGRVDLD